MKDDNTAAWERDEDEDHFECLVCHARIYDTFDDPAMFYPFCSRECAMDAWMEDAWDEDTAWGEDTASAWWTR